MQSRIILLSATLVISGCSIFSPVKTPEVTTYQLNKVPSVPTYSQHQKTLLVMLPEANSIYNSTNMIYSQTPYTVASYAKSRWAETPSKMLQQNLLQALHNTHYYRVVIAPPYVGRYDHMLNMQLLEIKQDFTRNPSVVRVGLRAQLLRFSNSQVLGSQEFHTVAVAPQNSPYGGVLAANRAAAELVRQVVAFCVKNSR